MSTGISFYYDQNGKLYNNSSRAHNYESDSLPYAMGTKMQSHAMGTKLQIPSLNQIYVPTTIELQNLSLYLS